MSASIVTLSNGFKCPVLGLGTWQSSDNPGTVEQAVRDAIDCGYRHFDCAFVYKNEKEVGKAIHDKISDGTVKREDLFVVTKLWINYLRKEKVIPACKKSVENLGLSYIDLYLIHWPTAYKGSSDEVFNVVGDDGSSLEDDVDFLETWQTMEECVKLGLVKSIGLSNFNSQQIERILSIAKIKPVMNQVECHPNLNQKKLRNFCNERGIKITAYCPLGSPKRSWAKSEDPQVTIDHPIIIQISQKYKKSSAQVVLRYLIDIGTIPIPKSSSKKRIAKNIDIFDFKLTPKDIEQIDQLDCQLRICPAEVMKNHKEYPFKIEF